MTIKETKDINHWPVDSSFNWDIKWYLSTISKLTFNGEVAYFFFRLPLRSMIMKEKKWLVYMMAFLFYSNIIDDRKKKKEEKKLIFNRLRRYVNINLFLFQPWKHYQREKEKKLFDLNAKIDSMIPMKYLRWKCIKYSYQQMTLCCS